MRGRALRFRIEGADRFQRVAEKIEPDGGLGAGREQIEDAAAHGIFTVFAHRARAHEAVRFQPCHDMGEIDHLAGTQGKC